MKKIIFLAAFLLYMSPAFAQTDTTMTTIPLNVDLYLPKSPIVEYVTASYNNNLASVYLNNFSGVTTVEIRDYCSNLVERKSQFIFSCGTITFPLTLYPKGHYYILIYTTLTYLGRFDL